MSPRKSSTSSGRAPAPPRPRYLGVEVTGEPLPPLSSRQAWEEFLSHALRLEAPGAHVRVVRAGARGAIAEVTHTLVPAARKAWNRHGSGSGGAWTLRTVRSWGTLLGAKGWLARRAGGEFGR